jgi:hypothetical protein
MDRRRRRPAQHQLVCLVPPVLPIWLLAGLPPDLEGAPHAALPLLTQSEGLHLPTTPQPQRPPPPRQPKLAVAGPAELVTCDQTIEHTVRFAKQTSAGPRHGRAIPSRPNGGPGWSWRPMPSCAWPGKSPAISGCRGSGPDLSRACHPTGCAAGFRSCWSGWARRLVRRNLQDARRAGPRAAARVPPGATRRSRSPRGNPPRSRPGRRRQPDRLGPLFTPSTEVDDQLGTPAGLNHKLNSERADETRAAAFPPGL